jgi:hypothetical protein
MYTDKAVKQTRKKNESQKIIPTLKESQLQEEKQPHITMLV